jgi:4-diphosphocytidyl-2-C-methyl-D-erythritol kinase
LRTAAKVNLDLRVGARLPDGYHPVETVLQTIDLGDELSVGPAPRGQVLLEVEGPEAVPAGEDNLVLRAARALLEAAGRDGRRLRGGLRLHLSKRVPSGAGLGGGSGDAAATLMLLDRYLGLGWPRRRLLGLARQLGADVPFFLAGGLARGSGRGDRLRRLAPLPRLPVLVLVPRLRLSTAKVYRQFDEMALTSAKSGFRMRPPVGGLRRRVPVTGLLNDLERPVFQRYPALARVKAEFREAGALVAGLSGSGSAVFGIFPGPPTLGGSLKKWRRRGWEIHRCHTLDERGYLARFR